MVRTTLVLKILHRTHTTGEWGLCKLFWSCLNVLLDTAEINVDSVLF
jgi:hypothetical protein